ncbi:MAG: hypothetical protein E6Q34_04415 [Burkholderiaceae bacterium]|nr:MAG: hypothetical protein E6Q34_04415 [Burkholderiaceae bacterium]
MKYILTLLCYFIVQSVSYAQDVQSLKWLEGRWTSPTQDGVIEEQWSLQGRSLLGVSRTMTGLQSKALELLMLEEIEGKAIMRLRFFGPAMEKALRGKEEPLRLALVEADNQHFVCLGIGSEEGTRLEYRLLTPNTLRAEISKTREGKLVFSERFEFARQ